jgi:hypothetical protein
MRSLPRAMVVIVAFVFASMAVAAPRPGGGGSPGPAPAPAGAGGLIAQFNPDVIAPLFAAQGFPSEVYENKSSDGKTVTRMVKTTFWPNDQSFGGAFGSSCNENNVCYGMSIFVNLGKSGVDTNWIGAWNARYFYVHAYESGGNLIFSFDVLLTPGVTADYIKTAVATFKGTVDLSSDFKP